jgi:hypothetical protein
MPAWLIDNVRRGAELVGGQGGAAPDYPFATLYRFSVWRAGRLQSVLNQGHQVGLHDAPAALLNPLPANPA